MAPSAGGAAPPPSAASASATAASPATPSSAAATPGAASLGTKWVARPAWTRSAAPIRAPVSARYVPTSAGSRDRKCEPPTSGKKPIPVSGIAKLARSVATRKRPWSERPTPPPITIPSHTDTCGVGHPAIAAFSAYSSRKKASDSPVGSTRAASITARTSPPAQNALPPAPLITIEVTAASPALAAYASDSTRTIGRLSALSAFGRSSTMFATEPTRLTWTPASAADIVRWRLSVARRRKLAVDAEPDCVAADEEARLLRRADDCLPRVLGHAIARRLHTLSAHPFANCAAVSPLS